MAEYLHDLPSLPKPPTGPAMRSSVMKDFYPWSFFTDIRRWAIERAQVTVRFDAANRQETILKVARQYEDFVLRDKEKEA